MNRFALIALILMSVGLNASAQIFLRLGAKGAFTAATGIMGVVETVFRLPILAGLACYGLSLVTWIFVLSRAEASYAYPFLGLGFVLVAAIGWAFLGENVTPQRLVAILMIAGGVVLLAST